MLKAGQTVRWMWRSHTFACSSVLGPRLQLQKIMYCSTEDDSDCLYLLSTFAPVKKCVFFFSVIVAEKNAFWDTFLQQIICFLIVAALWKLLNGLEWVSGTGRDRLLGRGQVSHNRCVMYQTAVVSDALHDYTSSPFIFFTMCYSVFWMSHKFTIFNFSNIFLEHKSIIITVGLEIGR